MGKSMLTYFDFAENDRLFFRQAYDNGIRGGYLAALGQNICERYLKYIVDEYVTPETEDERYAKASILRTHSLRRLAGYLRDDIGIQLQEDTESALYKIDGFYFSTRYPGEDSFIPSERDVDMANYAVEQTRDDVIQICAELHRHSGEMEYENGTENEQDEYDDLDEEEEDYDR